MKKTAIRKSMKDFLKTIRKFEGITQLRLSRLSGVQRTSIARFETDRTDKLPRLDKYVKLFSAMGYKISIQAKKGTKNWWVNL
jgi:transcriptional regulator with XRE-family HTH domain